MRQSAKLNRNSIDVIEGQQLMAGGKFDPSAAVREIRRVLQTARRSRSALDTDKITREICGLYTSLPVETAYVDGDLGTAKAVNEKSKMALQNSCCLLAMAHGDSALRELSDFGTIADLRSKLGALARERRAQWRPALDRPQCW